MSPSRLNYIVEDMTTSDISSGSMWSAQPNKKQKTYQAKNTIHFLDDLKTLWESRWKSACQRRCAPFQDASHLDVGPLITALLQSGTTSAHAPAFATAFRAAATRIAADPHATPARLLNACALLRIARYPATLARQDQYHQAQDNDDENAAAAASLYALQRQLHARAARRWETDSPLEEVLIPHVHGAAATAHAPRQIPALVRVPLETLLLGRACPAVLVLSGSDRMGCTAVCERVLARGWAVVVVDSCAAAAAAAGEKEEEE